MEIEAAAARSTFHLRSRPSNAAVAHPLLSLTGAVSARWRGDHSFHAGAVVIGGGAWAVAGQQGAGKSSTLGWLAAREDLEILSDDVLVVDRAGVAFAGPRSLDLRRETAELLGVGDYLGVLGARERWRVALETTAAEVPLRGWVELAWGQEVRLEPLSASELFELALRNVSLRLLPPDPESLFSFLALPGWRLVRPRDFARMGEAAALLSEALGAR